MTASSASPLRAVLSAVSAGATTREELRRKVSYPDDVIDAALDHLIRTGRVATQPLTMGCVSTSCGGCPVAAKCSSAAVKESQSLPVSTATCQS